MGEDIPDNPVLFELPAEGTVAIPNFEEIARNEVPEEVLGAISAQDRKGTITISELLGMPQAANFGEGGLAYIVPYYEERASMANQQNAIYVVDVDTSGELLGIGVSSLTLDNQGHPKGLPFVRDTMSYTKGRGLGLRRLVLLNEINKRLFDLRLSSNTMGNPQAERLWQFLVQKGFAEEKEIGRYQFID
jgi:hypothetical protein